MDSSPLKRLPGEVLQRIIKLALSHDEPLALSKISSYNGLTQTCRQLRSDTWALFWKFNTFREQEPTEKMEISRHTKRLQYLLGISPLVVKHIAGLDLSLELRTATAQSWQVSIKHAESPAANCEQVLASGNDRIAQGKVWVFSRYLDRILDAYQQAGFEVFATPKFGRQDGAVRRFWMVPT
ncbi:uncharacterized protein MYCFIDRAFT_85387 [Pseudocercospora fijiensis CIRAD86]|uniref:F-box domain-containing protein n=1 Tax=Pseudocercospora fijiensis (strain CIRAD86) TaxID=383855 RepID=M3AES7_PSEFD|nr:uncharacterized protein MYCFIDRAFT_85387 [Pseudocercospora fijiensis CIRAD86]EME83121.1 hypothetical protein MYCFIDRAFT_85387 [Pseudocercospora fijiensis CIRAD86]